MKKILSMVMCLVLLTSLFTACSGDEQKSTDEKADTTNKTSEEKDTKDSTEEDSESDASGEWTWPLAEKKELSIWIVWQNDYIEDPNELKSIQKIEELTNVHIDWHVVNSTEAAEKFSLMVASGDTPDIIRGAETYYAGGLVKMVEDGISIELTDIIDKNMPVYSSLRTSIEKLSKDTVTDDGRIVAAYTLASKTGDIMGEKMWGGPSIRKDWLDETGMPIPETIDEWYETLKAIKANHPECEAPLMLGANGTDSFGSFTSAYGVLPEFYKDNGTVKFGPAEDGYRQWLETMSKWYAEGLIDQNFVTNDASFMVPFDYYGTGKATAGNTVWGYTAHTIATMGYSQEEDYWISAAPYPVLEKGDTPQAAFPMSELVKETTVVTATCEDPELAMRYLDFWYEYNTMKLESLGIENESYVDNGDGTYSVHDSIVAKVTDGTYPNTSTAMFTEYTLGTSDFGLYNWEMFDALYEGNPATEAYDVWNTAKFDLMIPPTVSMTDEESYEYAALYTSIQTLVQESTVQFIMGNKSMDEYDEFLETLESYDIARCLEIRQTALDRYLAR